VSVSVKICGIMDGEALRAAVDGGASFVGFVFYPASKNAIAISDALKLTAHIPTHIKKTGLFVDARNDELQKLIRTIPLDLLQLHGTESPARVAEIKQLTGLPVMKALRLQTSDHFDAIAAYEPVADRLLFDSRIGAEPSGGPINWSLLKNCSFTKPWMLAGGLHTGNLIEAVRVTGAYALDVSSGVEDHTGRKNPEKIREFISLANQL
jgi:phosphoribosylanthranilate isomerase